MTLFCLLPTRVLLTTRSPAWKYLPGQNRDYKERGFTAPSNQAACRQVGNKADVQGLYSKGGESNYLHGWLCLLPAPSLSLLREQSERPRVQTPETDPFLDPKVSSNSKAIELAMLPTTHTSGCINEGPGVLVGNKRS